MKELIQASMKRAFITFLIMAMIGLLCLAWVIPSAKVMFSTPIDLKTVDVLSNLDGMYVKTTLSDLYGSYYKHTAKRSYSHMHIMPIDNTYYIGVRVSHASVEFDNRFFESDDNLLEDISNGALLSEHQYEISGTIYKMSEEDQLRYLEYVDTGALPEGDHQYFLPYYLDVSDYGGNHNSTSIYLFGFLGIVLLLAGISPL